MPCSRALQDDLVAAPVPHDHSDGRGRREGSWMPRLRHSKGPARLHGGAHERRSRCLLRVLADRICDRILDRVRGKLNELLRTFEFPVFLIDAFVLSPRAVVPNAVRLFRDRRSCRLPDARADGVADDRHSHAAPRSSPRILEDTAKLLPERRADGRADTAAPALRMRSPAENGSVPARRGLRESSPASSINSPSLNTSCQLFQKTLAPDTPCLLRAECDRCHA